MINLLKKKQFLGVITSTLVSVFLAAGFVFAAVTVSTNVQIGSGTPDISLNGDDLYVGGTFEVEGISYFGGDIHASSTIAFDGATIGFGDAATDAITVAGTLAANSTSTFALPNAWNDLAVTTGNLVVGTKSGATTLDGEDAYVEGVFEVDGDVNLGDAITDTTTIASSLSVTATTTFALPNAYNDFAITTGNFVVGDKSGATTLDGVDAYVQGVFEVDGDVALNASTTFTPAAAGGGVIVSTGNFRVGTGTAPDVALNGEDAYVEGTFEVDGAAQFDGAFSVLSSATTTLTMTSSGTAGTCFVVDQVDGTVAYARFTASGITVNTTDCQ